MQRQLPSLVLLTLTALLALGCGGSPIEQGPAAAAPQATASTASTASATSEEAPALAGREPWDDCEMCVYYLERNGPPNCRELKEPHYQKACVELVESLDWWLANEITWQDLPCERTVDGKVVIEERCATRVVCSWIVNTYDHQAFCPEDPYYKRPTAFPAGPNPTAAP